MIFILLQWYAYIMKFYFQYDKYSSATNNTINGWNESIVWKKILNTCSNIDREIFMYYKKWIFKTIYKRILTFKKAIFGNLYTNFEEVTIEKILKRFLHLWVLGASIEYSNLIRQGIQK